MFCDSILKLRNQCLSKFLTALQFRCVSVHQRQSVLTALKQFSVAETVGVTVFQSVLTAVGSFRFLRWLASLSIKVS